MTAEQYPAILVVADYQTTVCIVSNVLRQIGYADIDVVANVAAAKCKLRDKSYGLVIADSALAHNVGEDFAAEIRSGALLDGTRLLVLAPQSQKALLGPAASDSYLFMPFNAATLQRRIAAALTLPAVVAGEPFTTSAGA